MAILGEVLDNAWNTALSFFEFGSVTRSEIISIAILLIVGIVGGKIIGETIRRLLQMTNLDDMAVRSGVQPIIRKGGYSGALSDLIADTIMYFVYLVVFLGVFNLLGVSSVIQYLNILLAFIPRLLIAVAVVIVGWAISSQLEAIIVRLFRSGSIRELIDETDPSIPAYSILAKFVKLLGYLASLIIALAVVGVNSTVIHAFLVILAVGLVAVFIVAGWGIIRNIAISLYLQLSQTFKAGDTIKLQGREGTVTHITPLYTKLSAGDSTFMVPNTQLIQHIIEKRG